MLGRVDICTLLIAHGASTNARSRDGNTALHKAAQSGHVATVKVLLDAGADRSVTNCVRLCLQSLANDARLDVHAHTHVRSCVHGYRAARVH